MPKISEVYKKLYHYTTWDGLLGILQTQTLWATHYKFLNDFSEFAMMREKFIEHLFPIVREKYSEIVERDNDHRGFINQRGRIGPNCSA